MLYNTKLYVCLSQHNSIVFSDTKRPWFLLLQMLGNAVNFAATKPAMTVMEDNKNNNNNNASI